MKKTFDYIVTGKAHNTKYINGYIIKNDYCELHITNLKEIDYIIKLDKEDFNKCIYYFWCICFVGRQENKKPIIYYTQHKIKYYLSKFLLQIDNNNNRVIFKNRNCLDYRKENLYLVKQNENFLYDIGKENKKGENLPNGITLNINSLGNKTGYFVHFNNNGEKVALYFGIKKYKTLENCFNEALKMKENLIKNKKTD